MTEADFYSVLDEFNNCMLLTFTDDGTPHARPMGIARREGSTLWFVSARDSAKTDELTSNRTAVITAQDERRWLAATGTASTDDSQTRVDQLWSAPMTAWFPDGPQDSDLVALSVDLSDGEYWDVSGGKLVRFGFGVAKSMATGTQIDADEEGDHARVDL